MYQNPSIWQELRYKYQYGGAHMKLIFINVAIFIVLSFALFFDKLLFKGLGSDIIMGLFLGNSDLELILKKPWTIFTNIFVHLGILHLFFNMIFLNLFGGIVRDLVGNSKIVPIYLISGLFGYLIFVLAYNVIPAFSELNGVTICGASGAVMGLTFAAVALAPDYEIRLLFLGNVKIKWIAIFYILIDILSIQGNNAGGSMAHLGGAFIGFFYIRLLQKGYDLGKPFYWVEDKIEQIRHTRPKIKVAHKKEEKVTAGAQEYGGQKASQRPLYKSEKQERLDEILDKINKSGYDSLSSEEKSFLFKISQED